MSPTSQTDRGSVVLDVQGVLIEIVAPSELRATVIGLMGDAATTAPLGARPDLRYLYSTDAGGHRFVRSDGATASGAEPGAAAATLAAHLHMVVAHRSTVGVFVHAAAFALDDHLVLVPGRSHTGKSSLVAAAVARGATYYSDEFAIVDAAGRVHPYARPISLRTPSGVRHVHVRDDLDGAVGTRPQFATVVLATEFRAGARWAPTTLRGARAALPIIDNTVHARRLAEPTMRAAAKLARTAVTLSGPRGEAADLLDELRLRLAELPGGRVDVALGGAP